VIRKIENNLNYKFKDKELLSSALSHSSIKSKAIPFERLEFLGDRILAIVAAEYIFKQFEGDEGVMAKMHAAFVCADSCSKIASKLEIDKVIKTAGKHLMKNEKVLCDAMEAVLGAIFIDGGFEKSKEVILRLWRNIFENYNELEQEPKTKLQELCQAKTGQIPIYSLISITGPDHNPEFIVSVSVLGKAAQAAGRSRKVAETAAARLLLSKIIFK
jgi:ribonuclease-3